jgi:hypothetical protein
MIRRKWGREQSDVIEPMRMNEMSFIRENTTMIIGTFSKQMYPQVIVVYRKYVHSCIFSDKWTH